MSLLQIIAHIVRIALPVCSGRLFVILASFVSLRMVAQNGSLSLAASFLAITGFTTVYLFSSSIFYAVGIRIRYLAGQNQSAERIGGVVQSALGLACLFAFPAAFLLLVMDKVMMVFGLDPQLVTLTKDYFFYTALSMFPMLLMTVLSQFYVGIGQSSFMFYMGALSFPLMVLSSDALVLGHWGFPALGLAGIGLAQLIVQSLIVLITLMAMVLGQLCSVYSLWRQRSGFYWEESKCLCVLGLPIGLQVGGELLVMALANSLMAYLGVEVLAAFQVSNQYALVIIVFNFALAQSLSCLISEAHGRQHISPDYLKKCMLASFLVLLSYLIPVGIIFNKMPLLLTKFYMHHHSGSFALFDVAIMLFRLAFVFLLLDGIRHLLTNILRGLQEAHVATRINLVALWGISLPLSFMAVFVLEGGPILLRLGFLSGFFIAIFLLGHYLVKKWIFLSVHSELEINL